MPEEPIEPQAQTEQVVERSGEVDKELQETAAPSETHSTTLQEGIASCNPKDLPPTTESGMKTLIPFVKKFKQYRLKRGFTQADVALSFGITDGYVVSQSTICRFEAMQLSLKSMYRLQPYAEKWLQQPISLASGTSTMRKLRKRRTTIKDDMKNVLESQFWQDQKPPASKISALADELDLEREVVRVWFCNRRQKEKRLGREVAQ